MEYFCIQPKLYTEFQCTGNNCPDNCCHSWGAIFWNDEEYKKLCEADCSENLRKKIETGFKPFKKKWIINYSENGYCPFITEDKMCSIQREMGAEFLSNVCMGYPRIFYNNQNFILRTDHTSCYRIMEMLINNEDIMILDKKIDSINDIDKLAGHHFETDADKAENPALNNRTDIYFFLYNIISDKSRSVETAITLGALAAQQISKFEKTKQYDKIPMVLEALKPQLNAPEQIKKLEAIQPNYTLKFSFVNKLMGNMFGVENFFDWLLTDGQPSREKYDIGLKNFEEAFADRPFALRNIALNILSELFISSYDRSKSVYENYCYIIACFACIKFCGVSIYYVNENPEINFIKFSAKICRTLFHKQENVDKVLKYLKEHDFTSPAHLALIIK